MGKQRRPKKFGKPVSVRRFNFPGQAKDCLREQRLARGAKDCLKERGTSQKFTSEMDFHRSLDL